MICGSLATTLDEANNVDDIKKLFVSFRSIYFKHVLTIWHIQKICLSLLAFVPCSCSLFSLVFVVSKKEKMATISLTFIPFSLGIKIETIFKMRG